MKQVVIIGVGGIGKRHVCGFLKTGRARVSVCDRDHAKLCEVLKTDDIVKGFADIGQAPLHEFDFAVIASPAHTHIPVGRQLAKAGLPFLTEKPLAATMNGVDDFISAVNAKGLVARVGYVNRVKPWVVRMVEEIRLARIGDVRMAYVNVSQDFRKYRPDYRDTYYAEECTGGGVILDAASHAIDLLLWTMGHITEVSAIYDRLEFTGVECEDSALISLRFASGAMAQISLNQFQKPNECTYEMIGTKGNLRLINTAGQLLLADDDSGNWRILDNGVESQTSMEIHESMFAIQAEAFMDAVEGQQDTLATLEDGRESLAVCLAAKKSYRDKTVIQLNPPGGDR